jgi:hypothetical protein
VPDTGGLLRGFAAGKSTRQRAAADFALAKSQLCLLRSVLDFEFSFRSILMHKLSLCILAATILASPGFAKSAKCQLTVEGTTYMDGPCEFSPMGEGGDFQISAPDNPWFAYIYVDPDGTAMGHWNADQDNSGAYVPTSRAHAPLGTLRRNDACWQNETVSVCAW